MKGAILKAVKVRLYPSSADEFKIASQNGGVRYVYNRTLKLRKYAYEKFGKSISKFDLIKHITKLRNRKSTSWLKDVDSQALQQSVANMHSAYECFFKGGGYPKFKSKHHSRQSFQYPQRVRIEGNKIYLPKVGWVKMKGWRNISGTIKTVTVSHEANQYHASILIEEKQAPLVFKSTKPTIGIDVGVKNVVTDSDGFKHKPLKLDKELSKLRLRAKQLSRKKKGSKNRKKAKNKLTKINLKIANKRKDFLHKLSTQYAENQSIVFVEDLKIKNMTKSSKGTTQTPGKNVKQKSALNRVITQQSWGMFFELLSYKLQDKGGELIKVAPEHTSQTCNNCGHINKKNRKSQSKFVCLSCSHTDNADINAAKNIHDRGLHGINASQQITA